MGMDHGEGPRDEGDPRSTSELVQAAMASADEDEYWTIVGVLWRRVTPEVFDTAEELCASDQSEARALGTHILSQLGAPDQPYRRESVDILLDLLSHEEDAGVLQSACIALGHLRDPRAIPGLVALKGHPDPDVRYGVAFGLLGHDDDSAIRAMIELSSQDDEDLRNWATFGLAQQIDTDTPEIRAALLSRLDDENDEVRGEAVLGLARRKDPRVIEPLLRELASMVDADEWWYHPIDAAAEMPDPRMCPYLESLKAKAGPGAVDDMYDRALAACSCDRA